VGKTDWLFDWNGSISIRHQFARDLIDSASRPDSIRDNEVLAGLLTSAKAEGEDTINLSYVLKEVLTCKFGNPIGIRNGPLLYPLRK
jgi:hypothetical protein